MAADPKPAPKWTWFVAGLSFFTVAVLAQALIAPYADWFLGLRGLAVLGYVADLSLLFIAAVFVSVGFLVMVKAMRWAPLDRQGRRRLAIIFSGVFVIWNAYSFAGFASRLGPAPVLWTLGLFSLAQAAITCALIWAAVSLCARLFERNFSRRAAVAGVS